MSARAQAFVLFLAALSMVVVGCLRVDPDEVTDQTCLTVPFANVVYPQLLDYDVLAEALEENDVRVQRVGQNGENLSLAFGPSWGGEAANVEGGFLVRYVTADTHESLLSLVYQDGTARALPEQAEDAPLRPVTFGVMNIVNETFPDPDAHTPSQIWFDTRITCD